MEQSNRTMRMYQSLAEIAEQALLNMETQQSAPASTTAELDPSILKAFAKRLVKVLDEIAAEDEVAEHAQYVQARASLMATIEQVADVTDATINHLCAALSNTRDAIRPLQIAATADNMMAQQALAQHWLDVYAPASVDPSLSEPYQALHVTVTTNRFGLLQALGVFDHELVAFHRESREFLDELVGGLYLKVAQYQLLQFADLVNFFSAAHLYVAIASAPEEYMVIGQLIQQLEPVLSDKIMSLSDLPTVATYVQDLYTNAAMVWQSNATLTPESDRLMAESQATLAQAATRDDYRSVVALLRQVRFEQPTLAN
ncbi:hypothetical protein LA429_05750 [Weissella cibaria]|uniref:hypothetical protein n=1 Tax=Weissella cibaria TaxID=137591 RepID=UPI001E5F4FB4|nr:hypothetical protein [Weissella cibaria]MCC6122239.1 hypothetical protein [Weissella cibaria]